MPSLLGGVVEPGKQLGDGLLSFITHIRDAESLALDLAVAAINDAGILGLETTDPGGDIDTLVVLHTGQTDGAIAFGSKEFKAASLDPLGDKRIGLGMTGVAILESLGGDVLKLRLKGIDVGNDRSARGHVALVVFLEFQEIEIVTAALHFGGAFHGLLGNREESHPGRKGKSLLAAGEHHIDTELIHGNRHHGAGGDSVDDKEHLGELLHHIREFLDRAHASGGSLVMNQGHHINVTLLQTGLELLGKDRLTPLGLKLLSLVTATLGDIIPLVGEGSVHAVEHLALHEIAEGTLHHSPGGGSGDIDGTGGTEKLLKPWLNCGIEFFEIIAAMANHGLAESLESLFGNLYGSGAEEFDV